jgi:hypothetical protein
LAAAQASFEALPEAERKAIQTDLIWTGHFNGAASGSYGPLTFRAINALKAGRGAPDGLLNPAERQALAQAAKAARDAAGFRLINDDRTGMRIGIPEKRAAGANDADWRQPLAERRRQDHARCQPSPPSEDLAATFEKATAVNPNAPGRKITYKLLRPDFFVVTGETPTGKFYRRLAAGPQGLRGFSIGYDKALSPSVDKLVIAIASSFEPFPTGPLPAAAGECRGRHRGCNGLRSRRRLRPTERYGVALACRTRSRSPRSRPSTAAARCGSAGAGAAAAEGRCERACAAGSRRRAVWPRSGVRSEALGERENLVLVAFGDDSGKRAADRVAGAGGAQCRRLGRVRAASAGPERQPGFRSAGPAGRAGHRQPLRQVPDRGRRAAARLCGRRERGAIQAFLTKAGVTLAPARRAANSAQARWSRRPARRRCRLFAHCKINPKTSCLGRDNRLRWFVVCKRAPVSERGALQIKSIRERDT